MGTLLDDFLEIDAMIGDFIFLWVCWSHFTFSDRYSTFLVEISDHLRMIWKFDVLLWFCYNLLELKVWFQMNLFLFFLISLCSWPFKFAWLSSDLHCIHKSSKFIWNTKSKHHLLYLLLVALLVHAGRAFAVRLGFLVALLLLGRYLGLWLVPLLVLPVLALLTRAVAIALLAVLALLVAGARLVPLFRALAATFSVAPRPVVAAAVPYWVDWPSKPRGKT